MSLLDLSCGEGDLISRLQADGVKVRGTHYREDDYIITSRSRLKGMEIDTGVDLLGRLPYEDAVFDCVTMSEVLEHLSNHFQVIQEAARVLRPGGYLVFSTPNIFRFHSRLKFCFSGTHKLIRRRIGWDLKPSDLYAYHINPVDFPMFHCLLHITGVDIQRLGITKLKPLHCEWLLLYPLIFLSTWLGSDRSKKNSPGFRAGERDLFKFLVSPALLASEHLLVVARKRV
jgi:2-polyprenyl-3-methyl-5-hydroxy-6-metoxy-1,4-benzoquinol methylase